jgi:hypothetical protein
MRESIRQHQGPLAPHPSTPSGNLRNHWSRHLGRRSEDFTRSSGSVAPTPGHLEGLWKRSLPLDVACPPINYVNVELYGPSSDARPPCRRTSTLALSPQPPTTKAREALPERWVSALHTLVEGHPKPLGFECMFLNIFVSCFTPAKKNKKKRRWPSSQHTPGTKMTASCLEQKGLHPPSNPCTTSTRLPRRRCETP